MDNSNKLLFQNIDSISSVELGGELCKIDRMKNARAHPAEIRYLTPPHAPPLDIERSI